MDMIFLDIERTYRRGVDFTDSADFLFHKRGELANQNLLTVLGTPDKVIGSLVRNVFDMLRIHLQHYNICSSFPEVPRWAALPLLESLGDAAALSPASNRYIYVWWEKHDTYN